MRISSNPRSLPIGPRWWEYRFERITGSPDKRSRTRRIPKISYPLILAVSTSSKRQTFRRFTKSQLVLRFTSSSWLSLRRPPVKRSVLRFGASTSTFRSDLPARTRSDLTKTDFAFRSDASARCVEGGTRTNLSVQFANGLVNKGEAFESIKLAGVLLPRSRHRSTDSRSRGGESTLRRFGYQKTYGVST